MTLTGSEAAESIRKMRIQIAQKLGSSPAGRYFLVRQSQFCFRPDPLADTLDLEGFAADVAQAEAALGRLRDLPARTAAVPEDWSAIGGSEWFDLARYFRQVPSDLRPRKAPSSAMSPADYAAASTAAAELTVAAHGFCDLICALHRIVSVHSAHAGPPGVLRTGQVFLGHNTDITKAGFVPPAPDIMPPCLDELDLFYRRKLDNGLSLPDIIRIGYQFCAIHPFRDGNARTVYLLYEVLLRHAGLLGPAPLFLRQAMRKYHFPLAMRFRRVTRESEWKEYVGFYCALFQEAAADTVRWFEHAGSGEPDPSDPSR